MPSSRDKPGVEGITDDLPSVVLVHGAWFDGSSWNEVMARLQSQGIHVTAVCNPMRSLDGDATLLRRVIGEQSGPVILVGHGWGGTVITQAAQADSVAGLVYISAFAPDQGESTRAIKASEPLPELHALVHIDGDGFVHFARAEFPHYMAHDLPLIHASVLASLHAPIHTDALDQPVNHAAWREIPAWYVLSAQDRLIPPALQRRMAARMHARIRELGASHVPFLSRPREVTEVIVEAATAAQRRMSAAR